MATKKVRMTVKISGTRNGEDWPAVGDDIVLPVAEADDLIRARMAVDPAAPPADEENALAESLGIEKAVVTPKAQKSVRAQKKDAGE